MKILKLIFTVVLSLGLFCGCAEQKNILEKSPVDRKLSLTATIEYENFTAKMSVERTDFDKWTFNITEPFALSGISFQIDGEKISAFYDDFTVNVADIDNIKNTCTKIAEAIISAEKPLSELKISEDNFDATFSDIDIGDIITKAEAILE